MTRTRRRVIFAALVLACLAGAAVAVIVGLGKDQPRVATTEAARRVLPDAQAEGRAMLVLRSLKPRGQVAVAPLGDTAGPRTYAPLSCERVYFAAGRGLCLARGGLATGLSAQVFGPDFRVRHKVELAGIPSRARVSADGRYGTVTSFVAGDSYAAAGAFSTRTTLIDMARGEKVADLEQFTVTRDGRQVTAIDVNYWGVTFDPSNSDHFYATLATGGKTYLIEGTVSGRTAHTHPHQRGVPVDLARRHADRVQEAHRPVVGPVAAHRAGPPDDARDAARRDALGRRPGRVARRRPRALRARRAGLGRPRRRQRITAPLRRGRGLPRRRALVATPPRRRRACGAPRPRPPRGSSPRACAGCS